ncbi:hypothetical protein [Streptomyces wuyuanensis]|uniref:hypothetical protein n=1 Tax=Streptomyces wuyuanensis TaxID=1196353 RepID=UPI0034449288
MTTLQGTPDPRELGVPKEIVHQSARTLRNSAAALHTFLNSLPEQSAQGSPADQDQQFITTSHHRKRGPLRWIRSWGDRTNTLVFGNAFDHIRAMERVLEGGEPVSVWPCVSLSRVVTEGLARICHLYDPAASSEARLTRIAAAWLDSCREQLTAAREFYPDRTLPHAEADWRKAQEKIEGAGMTIGLDSRERPNRVIHGDTTANLSVSLVDILRMQPAQIPAWYRISSGASHNTLWLVQQGSTMTPDGTVIMRADPDIITAATLAVLGAIENVTQTFGAYYGHEGTEAAVKTVQRRTIAIVSLSRKWRDQMKQDAQQRPHRDPDIQV